MSENQIEEVRKRVVEDRIRAKWQHSQESLPRKEKEPWKLMDAAGLQEFIDQQKVEEDRLAQELRAISEEEEKMTVESKLEASQQVAAAIAQQISPRAGHVSPSAAAGMELRAAAASVQQRKDALQHGHGQRLEQLQQRRQALARQQALLEQESRALSHAADEKNSAAASGQQPPTRAPFSLLDQDPALASHLTVARGAGGGGHDVTARGRGEPFGGGQAGGVRRVSLDRSAQSLQSILADDVAKGYKVSECGSVKSSAACVKWESLVVPTTCQPSEGGHVVQFACLLLGTVCAWAAQACAAPVRGAW